MCCEGSMAVLEEGEGGILSEGIGFLFDNSHPFYAFFWRKSITLSWDWYHFNLSLTCTQIQLFCNSNFDSSSQGAVQLSCE